MTTAPVTIRPLEERDLDAADRIVRLAFGTFNGLSNPLEFMGDAGYVHTRWRARPDSAFAAEVGGRLAGSNFAARWGTFGFFGPLSIDPEFWNRGYAGALIEPVIARFESWGITHAGLFTHAQSPKHIGLYQKFGFRPRSLTLILEKTPRGAGDPGGWTRYSRLETRQRREAMDVCRRLTDRVHPGLDATSEIESIRRQSLGDTILLTGGAIDGVAACHAGAGSEAGSGAVYVKFGAVRPGARGAFRRLLAATEAFADSIGAVRIVAGVNTAREEAYEEMLTAGFRVLRTGIAMHRPNAPGFNRPGVFAIDDWR